MCCGSLWGMGLQSEAKDLTDVFERGFAYQSTTLGLDTVAAAREFAPVLSSAVAQAVTQEFPLASAAPAYTFRYNAALSVFERSTGVPGPLFSERALTLGKGQFNFSIGYSYIEFDDVNGTSLQRIRSPGLFGESPLNLAVPVTTIPPGIVLDPDETLFSAPTFASGIRTRLDLNAHATVVAFRYGLLDNLDISFAIPILNTFVRVRNELERVAEVNPSQAQLYFAAKGSLTNVTRVFGFRNPTSGAVVSPTELPFVKSQRPSLRLAKAAGSATGIGDISIRAKYRFLETEAGGGAVGLNLQLPSGEVRDFQGTDETHVSTFVFLSHVMWDRVEPHLNLGIDFNADDVDRSSFLFAGGLTFLVGSKLGIILDFIGRSEFGRFPLRIPESGFFAGGAKLDRKPESCTSQQPCSISPVPPFPFFPVKIERNDFYDFSFGLRYPLGQAGSVFFGGIVPLTDDGFRADFIPSGGVEYTF
jgi:hypothetical protein